MELREKLELVDVEYESNGTKAIMTFLDQSKGCVYDVNFNRLSYDRAIGKYVEDDAKAAKVDAWCEEYFGDTFENLPNHIGEKHDIYVYDSFCSLYPVNTIEKFDASMEGEMFYTTIEEIVVDDIFIKIRYKHPDTGKTYESKMTMGKYLKAKNAWFQDPMKVASVHKRFEEKYGVPVAEKDKLIGTEVIVEVRKAFDKYFGDIKNLPSKGKKK